MGIEVNNNDTSAAVSRVRPRVSVAAVDPVVGVQYVAPATSIAYIDLAVGVFVDTNGFYKLLAETFLVTDTAVVRSTKPFTDSVTTAEDSVYALTKPQVDNLNLADVFSRVVGFNREFVETVTEADDQSFSVAKALAETFTTPHTEVFDHQKLLADGVAMNDGMEAEDGFGIALTRGISNVTMVSDNRTLSFTGSRVESVAVQDSGSLRSQGYCDFSYFAEDYVGVALTF